eukprot:gene9535-biopygen3228
MRRLRRRLGACITQAVAPAAPQPGCHAGPANPARPVGLAGPGGMDNSPPPGAFAGCTRSAACIRPGRGGRDATPGIFGCPARATGPAGPVRMVQTAYLV